MLSTMRLLRPRNSAVATPGFQGIAKVGATGDRCEDFRKLLFLNFACEQAAVVVGHVNGPAALAQHVDGLIGHFDRSTCYPPSCACRQADDSEP